MTTEQGNPYCTILDIIRQEVLGGRRESWRVGTVKSISPFAVECGGAMIDKKSIQANLWMLNPLLERPYLLEVGDYVALLCNEEADSFIAICKLV